MCCDNSKNIYIKDFTNHIVNPYHNFPHLNRTITKEQQKLNPIIMTQTPVDIDIKLNKRLRSNLDEQLQTLKESRPSRERSLAITKIQEAIMWLGMDLKRLGTPNPYPTSYDDTNTTVEPTADYLKM